MYRDTCDNTDSHSSDSPPESCASAPRWPIGTYRPPKHLAKSEWRDRKWPLGACLAADDNDAEALKQWLEQRGLSATEFRFDQIEDFISFVEDEQVTWTVATSAGPLLGHPLFDRLFRALVETDTDLYTAADNCCLSSQLLLFAVRNWEFMTPYVSDEGDGTSRSSQTEALRRIEARLKEMRPFPTDFRKMAQDRLSVTEQDLFDAADPVRPLTGNMLAAKAGHALNGHVKGLLSSLVKQGLLDKRVGGYVRTSKSQGESQD